MLLALFSPQCLIFFRGNVPALSLIGLRLAHAGNECYLVRVNSEWQQNTASKHFYPQILISDELECSNHIKELEIFKIIPRTTHVPFQHRAFISPHAFKQRSLYCHKLECKTKNVPSTNYCTFSHNSSITKNTENVQTSESFSGQRTGKIGDW